MNGVSDIGQDKEETGERYDYDKEERRCYVDKRREGGPDMARINRKWGMMRAG